MIGYADLKEWARELREPVKNLIALAPNNDPFYAEVPNRKEKAEWIAALWGELGIERFGSVHLRRVHYWLISHEQSVVKPDGETYRNTQRDWQYLVMATLAARYLGLVPTEVFVDRRNPEPKIYAPPTRPHPYLYIDRDPDLGLHAVPENLEPPLAFIQGMSPDQPNVVEIWVEKATVNDVLEPIARRHHCNLVTGIGEESETACRAAIQRAAMSGKPMRILYISDFDPGGRSMPVAVSRKIEYWIRRRGLSVEITLEPIALLPDQVEQYSLPREPIKETERRAGAFQDRFGVGAVELDALEAIHPGELSAITERAVTRYIDPTLADRTRLAEQVIDREFGEVRDAVVERHRDAISELQIEYLDLREQLEDLGDRAGELWEVIAEAIEAEAPEIEPHMFPGAREQEPEAPLFDSRRTYLEQLEHYETWKNPGTGESS